MVLGLGDSAGGGEGGGVGRVDELELRHGWLEYVPTTIKRTSNAPHTPQQ